MHGRAVVYLSRAHHLPIIRSPRRPIPAIYTRAHARATATAARAAVVPRSFRGVDPGRAARVSSYFVQNIRLLTHAPTPARGSHPPPGPASSLDDENGTYAYQPIPMRVGGARGKSGGKRARPARLMGSPARGSGRLLMFKHHLRVSLAY
ncbi:hypothetical protein HYPSUDRAFT_208689 [Hypholoma sublateritium FD-334 SS-4]|uniref:Uncharacterized protein n=1 Tax=Hypholoma sublateritium (strain FD-334 SS-4) TaxID=945553 RepID=A0A0D2LUC5_HYPSF|nr:hypothetical protein HYPSUDRAFT_208689 [Hypholoma sublateritium FD-334 SS-4]